VETAGDAQRLLGHARPFALPTQVRGELLPRLHREHAAEPQTTGLQTKPRVWSMLARMRAKGLAALGVVVLLAGCGGGGKSYTPEQQRAIDAGKQLLKAKLGTGTSSVSEVEDEGDFGADNHIWRVEFDTADGHRCVYLNQQTDGNFVLQAVKAGNSCGGVKLYDRTEAGLP